MDGLQFWIQIGTVILMLGNIVGLVVIVYKFSNDPDVLMDKQLGINAKACDEKHKRIDEIIVELKDSIKSIEKSVLLIKENDIKYIENEMRRMSDIQTKILTIIEYKEGQKQ